QGQPPRAWLAYTSGGTPARNLSRWLGDAATVGKRSCVGRVLQDRVQGAEARLFPQDHPRMEASRLPPGQFQALVDEGAGDFLGAFQLKELGENQTDAVLNALVGVEANGCVGVANEAGGQVMNQFTAFGFGETARVKPQSNTMKLCFRHGALVTCLVNHKLYFSRVHRSEPARIAARSPAPSPAASTPFGGRMSHGSSCNFPTDNAPRYRRRGPICQRRALPGTGAGRNSSPRPCSAWPGTVSGCARAARNAPAPRTRGGARLDAPSTLVPAPRPRAPALRPLLLGHGP